MALFSQTNTHGFVIDRKFQLFSIPRKGIATFHLRNILILTAGKEFSKLSMLHEQWPVKYSLGILELTDYFEKLSSQFSGCLL